MYQNLIDLFSVAGKGGVNSFTIGDDKQRKWSLEPNFILPCWCLSPSSSLCFDHHLLCHDNGGVSTIMGDIIFGKSSLSIAHRWQSASWEAMAKSLITPRMDVSLPDHQHLLSSIYYPIPLSHFLSIFFFLKHDLHLAWTLCHLYAIFFTDLLYAIYFPSLLPYREVSYGGRLPSIDHLFCRIVRYHMEERCDLGCHLLTISSASWDIIWRMGLIYAVPSTHHLFRRIVRYHMGEVCHLSGA